MWSLVIIYRLTVVPCSDSKLSKFDASCKRRRSKGALDGDAQTCTEVVAFLALCIW